MALGSGRLELRAVVGHDDGEELPEQHYVKQRIPAQQALAYVKAVTAKPDWGNVPLDAVVVHVNSNRGYDWIPVSP